MIVTFGMISDHNSSLCVAAGPLHRLHLSGPPPKLVIFFHSYFRIFAETLDILLSIQPVIRSTASYLWSSTCCSIFQYFIFQTRRRHKDGWAGASDCFTEAAPRLPCQWWRPSKGDRGGGDSPDWVLQISTQGLAIFVLITILSLSCHIIFIIVFCVFPRNIYLEAFSGKLIVTPNNYLKAIFSL